jgi:PAS domain S-box-containing protein
MSRKLSYEELEKRVQELEKVELERERTAKELTQLFSMSLDMICIADINTATFIKVNPAFTEVLGFSEEELLEKPFFEFIHPEDLSATMTIVEQDLQKGTSAINFENRYRCKDGSYRWLSWVSHPYLEKGVTYAIARDISALKYNQEELEKNQALLDATGQMAKVGGWQLDANTLELTWTKETHRIHEVPLGSKPPLKEAINFFHPEDRQRMQEAIQRALDHGEPYDMEARFITARGKDLWTRTICHPEIIDGKTAKLIGTFQDITDQKKTEEALKESEERYRKLHDASFGGLFIHDQGIVLDCNQGLSDISGYTHDELIGMDALNTLIAPEWRETVRKNIASGFGKPYEVEGVRKDGTLYPLYIHGKNIPYKGRIVRAVEYRDLTEKKLADKEKEDLEGKLRQAQKMEAIGRLAGGVAHDFNNMLGVILGYVGMALADLDPSHPIYPDLEQIRKAGERSADLTRQLLSFARKQTVSPKVLDLNKTVAGMTRMLKRLIGEDIDLAWLPDKNAWPVKMDPSQLDQILANLCVNARDAITDVGKVTIETGNAEFDTDYCNDHPGFLPGEYVLLAVSDDGCGMEPEMLENIFEPFFTTKKSGKGTGLGLATVYGVVRQNNGFVNVYSEPGQGTTFKIYLPRHRTQEDAFPDKESSQPIERGHETILVVEDESAILKMTVKMLERLGHQVLAASTPGEAIQLAQAYSGEIDLLVTDVVMPEMNGRDLAKNILPFYPNLHCLFMSGYTANVIAHHGVLDKGVNFIPKPFSEESLGAKVREALNEDREKS